MEGVDTDTHVERLLASHLDNVLVGANAGGLEGLAGELLVLVRDQVDAEGEVVDVRLLAAQVENADLAVCKERGFFLSTGTGTQRQATYRGHRG